MNVRSTWHIFMTVRLCEGNRQVITKWSEALVTSARQTQPVRIPWEAINVPANQVSMGMEGSVVKSMNVKLQELIAISMQTVLIKLDFMFVNVNLVSGQIQKFPISHTNLWACLIRSFLNHILAVLASTAKMMTNVNPVYTRVITIRIVSTIEAVLYASVKLVLLVQLVMTTTNVLKIRIDAISMLIVQIQSVHINVDVNMDTKVMVLENVPMLMNVVQVWFDSFCHR